MCRICRSNPCSARCPNSQKSRPAHICEMCGKPIYPLEAFYMIDSLAYCEKCIDSVQRIAGGDEDAEF